MSQSSHTQAQLAGKSIRVAFVERFGEEAAALIEAAASEHANGSNSGNKGSDPFKWALCICIGYQCCEVDGYRAHHGITVSWAEIDQWIKDNARLDLHDGDVDYLAALAGAYKKYMPKAAA